MSSFTFVSHEKFPDDLYIKEVVYLCFDNKYRIAYARKPTKNGGAFWGPISAGVTKDGSKKYIESFSQDSNFVDQDVKAFLDNRSWEEPKRNLSQTMDLPF